VLAGKGGECLLARAREGKPPRESGINKRAISWAIIRDNGRNPAINGI
jgi:hypothetical protein